MVLPYRDILSDSSHFHAIKFIFHPNVFLVYPLLCIVEQKYGKLVVIFGQKAIRVVSLQESATQSGSYR